MTTARIVSGPNLADKIQIAQDDASITTVRIEGGGSLTKPVILRKYTQFDSSTYSIDITDEFGIIQGKSVTDYGAFLLADGVLVEGTWRPPQALIDYFKNGKGYNWDDPYLLKVQALTQEELAGAGTTFLESTYTNGGLPAISAFQALNDTKSSHTEKSANLAVIGFHIKGRQRVYDGGVRSTVLFGNCHRALAMYNYLEDTGSIGITFGGSALENNNYANDVVAYRNCFSGVAAANTATINTENAYIFENYTRKPGHRDPRFGGGVCGHDHETNSPADHTKNIWVYNNLYDYEEAAFEAAGSGVVLQDPYFNVGEGDHRGPTWAVNNVIIGGRGERSDHRYMTNGVFLNGLKGAQVVNNYVFRTGQNAIQAYGISDCLIQDNDLESTGGSGEYSVKIEGAKRNVFRRNNYRDRAGLNINTQAGFLEICGEDNVYESNLTNGVDRPNVLKVPC